MACEMALQWRYGKEKISRPGSSTSKDQIDLMLYNKKTIEVRSSCVQNGMDFAIFMKNKIKPDEQYFDVIGPYSNHYKPGEIIKDYYMRVYYECNKIDFMKLLHLPDENQDRADETKIKLQEQMQSNYLRLYITGGATCQMMQNPEIFQTKHLTASGGQVQIESDYCVIPLAKSLDIGEFLSVLERENDELIPQKSWESTEDSYNLSRA